MKFLMKRKRSIDLLKFLLFRYFNFCFLEFHLCLCHSSFPFDLCSDLHFRKDMCTLYAGCISNKLSTCACQLCAWTKRASGVSNSK